LLHPFSSTSVAQIM